MRARWDLRGPGPLTRVVGSGERMKKVGDDDGAIRTRLRRLQGQVGGVIRMIDEGESCEHVVTQLLAVRAAIDAAAARIVLEHVDECMRELPPRRAREAAHEAIALLSRIG